jgi:hypothetical protein
MCMYLYVCVPLLCVCQVGKAQHIQFDPLRANPVTIPAGGVCVVANSLVEASKVCFAKACLIMKAAHCVVCGVVRVTRSMTGRAGWCVCM